MSAKRIRFVAIMLNMSAKRSRFVAIMLNMSAKRSRFVAIMLNTSAKRSRFVAIMLNTSAKPDIGALLKTSSFLTRWNQLTLRILRRKNGLILVCDFNKIDFAE